MCIKYGIEDTQRSEKERKKKITRFLERKKGKIARNHLNPLIYKANVIFQ